MGTKKQLLSFHTSFSFQKQRYIQKNWDHGNYSSAPSLIFLSASRISEMRVPPPHILNQILQTRPEN